MNVLISWTDAPAFTTVESWCSICICIFPNRKVPSNSEGFSPNACLAVVFSVFWKSANGSLLGSKVSWFHYYLHTSLKSSRADSFV